VPFESPTAIASNNPAIWETAVETAAQVLPLCLGEPHNQELPGLAKTDRRVAEALRNVELSLVEAFVPMIRDEVEAGKLKLSEGDDYLSLSANLVELLMAEWLVLDLRD